MRGEPVLTISRKRLLLECSHCGQAGLIDVAVSDDGMMGVVNCDECKTNGLRSANALRRRPRRPLRHPGATLVTEVVEPTGIPTGDVLSRVRLALGDFSPAQ